MRRLNWHYGIILITALAVHGLILLNDGVYWDGWLIYRYLVEKDWNSLYATFMEAGSPTTLYFHWLMGKFPDIVLGYRLVALSSIVLMGILVYKSGRELGLLQRSECLWIALLSLSYPAFQVSFELIIVPSVFYYCLFVLAFLLMLRAERARGLACYFLCTVALLFYFLSFSLNSLMVFYYGFLLLWFVFLTRLKGLDLKRAILTVLPRRLYYVILPFAFWSMNTIFFRPYGLYAGYNRFNRSMRSLLNTSWGFLYDGIFNQLVNALIGLLPFVVIWALAIVAVIWAYHRRSKNHPETGSSEFSNQPASAFALLIFGLLLLVFGTFPYVVTGSLPTVHGWLTRNSLLLGLPMAIVIVALARLVFPMRSGLRPMLGTALLVTLGIAFGLATITNYIAWEARWVKDRSVMLNLSSQDEFKQASIYWIEDAFPLIAGEHYRFYEWASMFKQVWHNEERVGLDKGYNQSPIFLSDGERYHNELYMLSGFDPLGCQATLAIYRGDSAEDPTGLSSRYVFFRLFQPDKLDQFLKQVTRLEIQPMSVPEAAHCL